MDAQEAGVILESDSLKLGPDFSEARHTVNDAAEFEFQLFIGQGHQDFIAREGKRFGVCRGFLVLRSDLPPKK